jgi:hypothetical protein
VSSRPLPLPLPLPPLSLFSFLSSSHVTAADPSHRSSPRIALYHLFSADPVYPGSVALSFPQFPLNRFMPSEPTAVSQRTPVDANPAAPSDPTQHGNVPRRDEPVFGMLPGGVVEDRGTSIDIVDPDASPSLSAENDGSLLGRLSAAGNALPASSSPVRHDSSSPPEKTQLDSSSTPSTTRSKVLVLRAKSRRSLADLPNGMRDDSRTIFSI